MIFVAKNSIILVIFPVELVNLGYKTLNLLKDNQVVEFL